MLQLSEICRHNEDVQMAAELVGKWDVCCMEVIGHYKVLLSALE